MSPEPDRHSDEFAGTHPRWKHNDGRFDHADRFEVTWLANADGTGGGWYWIEEAWGASTGSAYEMHPDAYGMRIATGPFGTSHEVREKCFSPIHAPLRAAIGPAKGEMLNL